MKASYLLPYNTRITNLAYRKCIYGKVVSCASNCNICPVAAYYRGEGMLFIPTLNSGCMTLIRDKKYWSNDEIIKK